MKSIGLYIHIPWCLRKCPYCDFNSHKLASPLDESGYVRALLQDLEDELTILFGYSDPSLAQTWQTTLVVDSIFFGGGTPSTFSVQAIAEILAGVQQRLPIHADCEITLEANPGASEQARFAGYRAAGVNRLSIGIQSFDATQLKQLGRVHSAEEAAAAIQMARRAGFDNLNLDMMFALPEQSLTDARTDLNKLIDAEPSHISYYQLTIEPNTYFYAHPPPMPDDERQADIQLQGQAMLATAGYAQYEVSAYARPGRQCRHNRHYWQFDDYLGIGAGAHGKWTDTAGNVTRNWKYKQPRRYQQALLTQGSASSERVEIAPDRLLFEYLLNRLRLMEPITFREMAMQLPGWTATLQSAMLITLEPFVEEGLVRRINTEDPTADGLLLTELGQRFINRILLAFLPADNE